MRAQRICLLTLDFPGPIRNGGMGTAFLACAERFRDAGHAVTVLFPADYSETLPLAHWRRHYADQGLDFVPLHLSGEDRELGFGAWQWLKRQPRFDAIHFHEMRGPGFWPVVAKRTGLGLADTALVCQVHSPTLWHFAHSGTFLQRLEEVEVDHMERRSVEGADVVVAPSRYMLEELGRMGWRLPADARVLPNMLPASFPTAAAPDPAPRGVEELVFFGRLEARKGLDLFCRAVARLPPARRPRRVSFLGKVGHIEGMPALAWLAEACGDWTLPWRVVNDLDAAGARAFLAGPGRLGVIASAMENAPYAVIECLAAGLPFLAPAVGGIPELVDAADHPRVLYPRTPEGLAQALARARAEGAAPARAAVPPEAARAAWVGFQQRLAPPLAAPALVRDAPPLVSVCMGSFNRHETLAAALASLEAQTHAPLEVVLVDDASTDPATLAFLAALAPRFAARGWTLLRNAVNSWQGVTRRRAAEAAQGEFLLFMDDDNLAFPDEVEVFLRAALHSGAAVLTCQPQGFVGPGAGPAARAERPSGWMPIGPCPALGAFTNSLGDANMFMRRDAWERLGGFTPERAYFEDWEFLQAASLAGLRVECLPEVLYAYRIWEGAQTAAHAGDFLYRSYQRALRPTLAALPEALRPALRFAAEQRLAGIQARREGYWARAPHPSPEQARIAGLPPNGAEALLALADAMLTAGQPETAALLTEQARRIAPGHPLLEGR